jgi:hypothetical protein
VLDRIFPPPAFPVTIPPYLRPVPGFRESLEAAYAAVYRAGVSQGMAFAGPLGLLAGFAMGLIVGLLVGDRIRRSRG